MDGTGVTSLIPAAGLSLAAITEAGLGRFVYTRFQSNRDGKSQEFFAESPARRSHIPISLRPGRTMGSCGEPVAARIEFRPRHPS